MNAPIESRTGAKRRRLKVERAMRTRCIEVEAALPRPRFAPRTAEDRPAVAAGMDGWNLPEVA
jgi:hypothetical protein